MISRLAKIFFAFIFVLTVSSCERKSCKNVVCPVDQACNNGQCYCQDGYEGTDCQTLSYQKYLNLNNSAYEQCNSPSPFPTNSINITWDGSYANQIHINGLMGNNCYDIIATIHTDTNNEGNIVEISQQSCGGSTVSGQGTYDRLNHRLTLNLEYYISGTPYSCTTTIY